MDAINEVFYMMLSAVVGIFFFKLGVMLLPNMALTDPLKRIAAFL